MNEGMSDIKFWRLVAEVKWPELSGEADKTKKRIDCDLGKRWLILAMQLSADSLLHTLALFNKALEKKLDTLYAVIAKAEKQHPEVRLNYGGDDSFSDMVHHVIGMGEDYYNKVLANPELLRDVRYHESFSYCIPSKEDIQALDRSYHAAKAEEFLEEWAPFRQSEEIIAVEEQAKFVDRAIELMKQHKLEELPNYKEVLVTWKIMIERVENSVGHFGRLLKFHEWLRGSEYHLANIISDASQSIRKA